MDVNMAKQILNTCIKHELRDHAFGDVEVEWYDGEVNVGNGYFSSLHSEVSVTDHATGVTGDFKGYEAHELRKCFASDRAERNDSTGPDEFKLGKTMPGLTKEGVRKELEGQ